MAAFEMCGWMTVRRVVYCLYERWIRVDFVLFGILAVSTLAYGAMTNSVDLLLTENSKNLMRLRVYKSMVTSA